MKKTMLISLYVFSLSLLLFYFCLHEIWDIEDRFWEPDGTNLKQGKLNILYALIPVGVIGCILSFLAFVIALVGSLFIRQSAPKEKDA